MEKIFKVKGSAAKKIMKTLGYWWYYDSGYNICGYIKGVTSGMNDNLDTWWLCDSTYDRYNNQIVDNKIYEMKIEHHDYDYITRAFNALVKESAVKVEIQLPFTIKGEKKKKLLKAKEQMEEAIKKYTDLLAEVN